MAVEVCGKDCSPGSTGCSAQHPAQWEGEGVGEVERSLLYIFMFLFVPISHG